MNFAKTFKLRDHLHAPVIPIFPFLEEKAKQLKDKVLLQRLDLINLGYIPNTGEWHTKFGTDGALLSPKPILGRRLFGSDERHLLTAPPKPAQVKPVQVKSAPSSDDPEPIDVA